MKLLTFIICCLLVLPSCTLCVQDNVFPKPAWAWSKEAQWERESRRENRKIRAALNDWHTGRKQFLKDHATEISEVPELADLP